MQLLAIVFFLFSLNYFDENVDVLVDYKLHSPLLNEEFSSSVSGRFGNGVMVVT